MGSKIIRTSNSGSNPGFVLSYFCEPVKILTLSFLYFRICQREKSEMVEDKIKQAFQVTSIQKMAVSMRVRAHTSTCTHRHAPLLGVVMMGTWEGRS